MMPRKKDRTPRFGQIAVERGYVTRAQLERGLEEQRRLREGGARFRLGQLLLHHALLSPAQLLRILAEQGRLRLCPLCGTATDLTSARRRPYCRGCGKEFERR